MILTVIITELGANLSVKLTGSSTAIIIIKKVTKIITDLDCMVNQTKPAHYEKKKTKQIAGKGNEVDTPQRELRYKINIVKISDLHHCSTNGFSVVIESNSESNEP